jgi:PAS domain S-box-containing protein
MLRKPLADFFYQTLWSSGALLCFAFVVVIAVFWLYVANVRKREKELLRTVEERTRKLTEEIEKSVQARDELLKSEVRYRLLAENSGDLIGLFDLSGTMTYASPSHQLLLGYDLDELISARVFRFINPKGLRETVSVARDVIRLKNPATVEVGIFKKSRDEITVEAVLSPIVNDAGVVTRILVSARDSTERKKLEQQLIQAQKMESIGTLAGGVAHDFNNILAMIMTSAELMKNYADGNDRLLRYANIIASSAERGSSIAKQLLLFASSERGEQQPVSLTKIVKETHQLLEHSFPKSIMISVDCDADGLMILGDGGHLQQMVLNLVINSRDAMPAGGKLDLKVSTVGSEFVRRKFSESQPVPAYVSLAVSDTGTGMDEATKQRIFDPFFTTKERGKGTGLGLAIVHGIVKNHRGYIDLQSDKGKGTKFTLYFPAIQSIAAPHRSISPEERFSGKETILFVDDEPIINETTADALQEFGYTVVTAENGLQALDMYANLKDRISLVITDVEMPHMDGKKLINKLRIMNPGVKIILSSGYLDSNSGGFAQTVNGILSKPFQMQELLRTIRSVLDATG